MKLLGSSFNFLSFNCFDENMILPSCAIRHSQWVMKGKDEIRKFYESLSDVYPEHNDDPIDFLFADNRAAIKVLVKNKTTDGKAITFNAVSWMTFENGRIKSIEAIFDSAKVLKDLKG